MLLDVTFFQRKNWSSIWRQSQRHVLTLFRRLSNQLQKPNQGGLKFFDGGGWWWCKDRYFWNFNHFHVSIWLSYARLWASGAIIIGCYKMNIQTMGFLFSFYWRLFARQCAISLLMCVCYNTSSVFWTQPPPLKLKIHYFLFFGTQVKRIFTAKNILKELKENWHRNGVKVKKNKKKTKGEKREDRERKRKKENKFRKEGRNWDSFLWRFDKTISHKFTR